MRPEIRDEVAAWLRKAREDLRVAEAILQLSPPAIEDALFHCQQAVEKALKAFLTFYERPFPKTHNLGQLAGACREADDSLTESLQSVGDLTPFAWLFRYPGDAEAPPLEESLDYLSRARDVLAEISERVRP
jgi:HEPN domain-containing protein